MRICTLFSSTNSDFWWSIRTFFGPLCSKKSEFGPSLSNSDLNWGHRRVHADFGNLSANQRFQAQISDFWLKMSAIGADRPICSQLAQQFAPNLPQNCPICSNLPSVSVDWRCFWFAQACSVQNQLLGTEPEAVPSSKKCCCFVPSAQIGADAVAELCQAQKNVAVLFRQRRLALTRQRQFALLLLFLPTSGTLQDIK